ncbi:uncharacterized protein VICG_01912 [Vittaforma corneae ATCC 50505]|uniref:Uncharacterized protein n=1 Tax=Vittaforma corneae (strain ATCC 50505) TaxID=993615 RepID=L2GKJ6_VITCO|nr:uncharacterized protein VICG_01912 [Vittaforma corneae ATCC 50505]ELA41030.1 hypothetical protein VICG_01912 [Vittaforma corneae ATCC 50505]
MKFLEIGSIIKTNALLSRLQAFDPRRSLEIEAYSCKQTREQKKHKTIPKPLRFYVSALELAFPYYDFSTMTKESFRNISHGMLKNELSFVFFTMYKNHEDVEEFVSYLDALLEQCVDVKRAQFFIVEDNMLDDLDFHRIFMVYDKRKRRVLIIKSILEKEAEVAQ